MLACHLLQNPHVAAQCTVVLQVSNQSHDQITNHSENVSCPGRKAKRLRLFPGRATQFESLMSSVRMLALERPPCLVVLATDFALVGD